MWEQNNLFYNTRQWLPLKIFKEGGLVRVTWPPKFWWLNANSSKTVKSTDFCSNLTSVFSETVGDEPLNSDEVTGGFGWVWTNPLSSRVTPEICAYPVRNFLQGGYTPIPLILVAVANPLVCVRLNERTQVWHHVMSQPVAELLRFVEKFKMVASAFGNSGAWLQENLTIILRCENNLR